jgi:S1-C subfamily serine protease
MHVVKSRCAVFILALILAPNLKAGNMDPDIEAKTKRAAVQVWMGEAAEGQKEAKWMGSGSGSFINRTGLVITNNHVIDPSHGKDPATAFRIRIAASILKYKIVKDGGTDDEKSLEAKVRYQNEAADLAILQIFDEEGEPLQSPDFLRIFPSQNLEIGDSVWLFGFPGGNKMRTDREKNAPVTVTDGNIVDLSPTPGGRLPDVITDVRAAPGNSGGPMVNSLGQIVGIVSTIGVDQRAASKVNARCVPGDLIGDMVRVALAFSKIRSDSDLEPFLHLLADRKTGEVYMPGLDRSSSSVRVILDNGDDISGELVNETLNWPSPVGTIEVPVESAAYALVHDERVSLLLDGGDLLTAAPTDAQVPFRSNRGRERMLDMDTVSKVIFKTGKKLEVPDVNGTLLEADGCRLLLTNLEGELKFEDPNGTVSLKLDDIRRIEPRAFDQAVTMVDGSTLSGRFESDAVSATLAWTGLAVNINLSKVRNGHVRRSNPTKSGRVERSLAQRLEIHDDDIAEIARWIEEGALDKAQDSLATRSERSTLKGFPKPLQSKIRLLDAELQLRHGEYEESRRAFRKLDRKDNPESVRHYAGSREYLLERFAGGKHQGEDLKAPVRFRLAAEELTDKIVSDARKLMKAYESRSAKPTKHRDWKNLIKKLKRQEDSLLTAAALTPGRGENDIFRMWRFRMELNIHEFRRLQRDRQELQRKQQDFRPDGSRSSQQKQQSLNRKVQRLNQEQQTIEREFQDTQQLLQSGGFRLDDPSAVDLID